MQETPSVQVECVLQTDLLDGCVGRSTHSDDIERIAVKMKWMTEIVLLNFIDQNDFNDGVQWNIDFVGAHAVGATIWWSIVAITELVGVDVVELRENRGWWGNVRNFINETYQMVATVDSCTKKAKLSLKVEMKGSVILTQKAVVSLWAEKFLNAVEIKAEGKENFDVGSLGQQCFVHLLGILQV